MPACVLTFKHEVAQVRVCVCTSESLNARTVLAFVCKHEMAQLCGVGECEDILHIYLCASMKWLGCVCVPT